MKKKLDEITKVKLIYSGELVVFAILFLVLGTLELTKVLHISDTVLKIFNWVTIFGSTWLIIDFVWCLVSKKKREKVCLLDKISVIPLPPYIIAIDILLFMSNETVLANREYFIAPVLVYLGVIYIFQAIYHWFNPLKDLLEVATVPDEAPVEEIKEETKEE